MNVLMTADTVGGVWSYAVNLAHSLQNAGCTVSLVTMGAALKESQRAQADGLDLHESEYKLEWMQDPWEDVEAAGEWLLDVERRLRPDVVHLNSFVHGSLPFRAPVLMTAHSCVFSWWSAVRSGRPPASWDRYREAVSAGLRGAGTVVAVSRFMAEELRRRYDFDGATVLHNGADANNYRPSEKQPLIFASGRIWDEAKNLAALQRLDVPWPICVAGEHMHPDGGEVTLDGCTMLGCLDAAQMKTWFSRAAIYASPALYEPFGLSVLEAALSGCALVLSPIPSFRELWTGAAIFASDTEEFEYELRTLAADRRKREDYAARARKRAMRYSLEAMKSRYAELYAHPIGLACA